ncbi:MAG TPA: peptidylprolyl isomerase [Xanthobacteraceae bacterium]
MKFKPDLKPQAAFPSALRGLAAAIGLALAVVATAPQGASAQGVVVLVNGDPITNFDIEQRSKLLQVSTQKTPPRQEVVEELINEKVKIQLLKRYTIPGVDKDVDNAYANMARRMRQSPKEFGEQLSKTGIMPETLKSRMKADIVWTQIIRGRYQASFQFSDRDIQSKIDAKHPPGTAPTTVSYDYTLRPILFVVPRGSPPAAFEARAKEAEALRAQFQSCEEGIALARNVRFVAVRAPVTKNSAELPAALRDILTRTEVGRLTPPETTQQGVEVYAVCGRKQGENALEKKEARDQLYNEAFESRAKAFLKELRSQAMIEYKQ